MPIIAENKGGNFTLIPANNHIARCYGMVEIGTVKEEQGLYAGKESHKVRISFETPLECHDFGKGLQPFAIHKEFTLSMHEKATLRKFLESWRGKAFTDDEAKSFDITKLLGKPCMLNVIHKKSGSGNDYADISSIGTLPKGFVCPDQVNETVLLSFDNWNQNVFDAMPDFVKEKIKKSKEYAAMTQPGHTETTQEPISTDDLPF